MPGGRREGAGRKPAEIDLVELEKLCAMQCTEEEIAAWFGLARETISRKKTKNHAFAILMARVYAKGRISVRRAQMRILESDGRGAGTMAVWLGKQLLGQRDDRMPVTDTDLPAPVIEVTNAPIIPTEPGIPK